MGESYGPFSTGAGDSFSDAKWQALLGAIFGTGVIYVLNGLKVTAGTGMTVNMDTGQATLTGVWYQNDASKALTISAADPTNSRIDLVVIHADLTAKTVAAQVITGTPAPSPVAPTITQTSLVWETALAQVLVPAGASSSSSFTISDVRLYAGPQNDSFIGPIAVLGISSGNQDACAINVIQGDQSTPLKAYIGGDSATSGKGVETHIQADNKGTLQDVFQVTPGQGTNAALVLVGGQPNESVSLRLGNMKVFSGSGNTTGVAHGLGKTPNMIVITPHGTTAEPVAYNNITSTTVDIYCTGAWTAIAIAQA